MKEGDLQKNCVFWFRLKYQNKELGLLVSIPNEGKTNGRLKSTGLCTGIPDLFIIKKGETKILFIELKTESKHSKLSPAQKEMHLTLNSLGQNVLVIRNIDSFTSIVDGWMLDGKIEE